MTVGALPGTRLPGRTDLATVRALYCGQLYAINISVMPTKTNIKTRISDNAAPCNWHALVRLTLTR